jgi:EAL domain-containing protein (putative c-di-GMP-specific phosphodiesterase class I)
MIIELARTLGMSVIAEGIETADQARALAALQCEYGQGFHLGRPKPAPTPARVEAAA